MTDQERAAHDEARFNRIVASHTNGTIRPVTEEEKRLLTHVSMFGSDGYPIQKLGGKWQIDHSAIHHPVLFKTKKEAVSAFEAFHDVLLEALAGAAYAKAVAA